MEQVIIDSDIIIDYLRTGRGLMISLLKAQVENKIQISISVVSIYELFVGKSSKKDEEMILEIIKKFKTIFLDNKIAKLAGELTRDNKLESSGPFDVFIAATAILFDSSLATKNKKHFSKIPGLKLILDKPE